ncbi:unnamed protein product [Prunus armeniaca]
MPIQTICKISSKLEKEEATRHAIQVMERYFQKKSLNPPSNNPSSSNPPSNNPASSNPPSNNPAS